MSDAYSKASRAETKANTELAAALTEHAYLRVASKSRKIAPARLRRSDRRLEEARQEATKARDERLRLGRISAAEYDASMKRLDEDRRREAAANAARRAEGKPEIAQEYGHAHAHSSPSHHLGECSEACRAGHRQHYHKIGRDEYLGSDGKAHRK